MLEPMNCGASFANRSLGMCRFVDCNTRAPLMAGPGEAVGVGDREHNFAVNQPKTALKK